MSLYSANIAYKNYCDAIESSSEDFLEFLSKNITDASYNGKTTFSFFVSDDDVSKIIDVIPYIENFGYSMTFEGNIVIYSQKPNSSSTINNIYITDNFNKVLNKFGKCKGTKFWITWDEPKNNIRNEYINNKEATE